MVSVTKGLWFGMWSEARGQAGTHCVAVSQAFRVRKGAKGDCSPEFSDCSVFDGLFFSILRKCKLVKELFLHLSAPAPTRDKEAFSP